MCRPYVCAQTILVCLIENEKGIKLKGLEFTETKLRVSRRHKISSAKSHMEKIQIGNMPKRIQLLSPMAHTEPHPHARVVARLLLLGTWFSKLDASRLAMAIVYGATCK